MNALDDEAFAEDAAWDRRMASALSIHDDIAAEEDVADAIVWMVVEVMQAINGSPSKAECYAGEWVIR